VPVNVGVVLPVKPPVAGVLITGATGAGIA